MVYIIIKWGRVTIIMGALLLFDDDFIHIVIISFSALIMTELILVAVTIRTWHWLQPCVIAFSLAVYMISIIILRNFFGKNGLYYNKVREGNNHHGSTSPL